MPSEQEIQLAQAEIINQQVAKIAHFAFKVVIDYAKKKLIAALIA